MTRRKTRPAGTACWAAALRLLARRDYGTAELQQRLADRGFPPEAVEEAIARAREFGYLDDARYAEHLARTLLESGRAAGSRLILELRRRGLPRELIAAGIAAAGDGGRQDAVLRALIARRFAGFDFAAADDRERRRVVTYLQRRGFPLDRILTELKRNDP